MNRAERRRLEKEARKKHPKAQTLLALEEVRRQEQGRGRFGDYLDRKLRKAGR